MKFSGKLVLISVEPIFMNSYIPQQSKILAIKDLTADTKLYQLDLKNFHFTPGQFLMVGLLGYGEVPISIASSPTEKNYLELAIRQVGRVTKGIYKLSIGDYLWIRGPYGNGFPIHKFKNKNIIIISGGCGLAPMRSVINYTRDNKNYFENVQIIYGTKTPKDILFKDEIKKWKKFAEVLLTVDSSDKNWHENTGFVVSLISPKTISVKNSVVIMCGPQIMYETVNKKLLELGFDGDNIYLSLERNMQCGIGLCQHCTCGDKYVCSDGPVFSYNQIKYQSYKND